MGNRLKGKVAVVTGGGRGIQDALWIISAVKSRCTSN